MTTKLAVACATALVFPGAGWHLTAAEPAVTPVASTRLAPEQPLGNRVNPVIDVQVERPILALAEPPATTTTLLAVTTWQFPANAVLSYQWRQIQDELRPLAVKMADRPVAFSSTTAKHITATFPGSGVYTIRVTATDTANKISLSRNTWISVWDRPMEGAGSDLRNAAPGILPPTSVQQLNPDPGPFAHPRTLCTNRDWPDIRARCFGGSRIATQAFDKVKVQAGGWGNVKGRFYEMFRALEAYAAAGYAGTSPSLLPGITLTGPPGSDWGNPDTAKVSDVLTSATEQLMLNGFIQWLSYDPALPLERIPAEDQANRRRLATVLAAWCRTYLAACWSPGDETNPRGTFHDQYAGRPNLNQDQAPSYGDMWKNLALAYDFIAPWMTASEQRAARNLLVAGGLGRFTWRTAKGGPGWNFSGNWRGVSGGGGTFSNFGEDVVMATTVVAGEDSAVDPAVLRAFGAPARPGAAPADPARYPDSVTWPHATASNVHNLVRQVRAMDDIVSPAGFYKGGEEESYGLFWPLLIWPPSLAEIRQGAHNQFITGRNYAIVNQIVYSRYPYGTKDFSYQGVQRHSGNGDHRFIQTLLLRHMYPNDPATAFIYALRCKEMPGRIPFMTCLFGVDPTPDITGPSGLTRVAQAKGLPLTKGCEERGRAVLRSGWEDDSVMIDIDAMRGYGGHACAEANSFSLLALGRSWSLQGGYHKIYSNWHSGIQVQHQPWAADPTTKGFIGILPFWKPVGAEGIPDGYGGPAKLVEVRESPDRLWSLMVGDATACYQPAKPFPPSKVDHALRSIVLVRGKRPYVVIVDDIRKDGQPQNWRWFMHNPQNVGTFDIKPGGPYSMTLADGATATESILLHQQDAGQGMGLPRLLVRDCSENDNTKQPAMHIDQSKFNGSATNDARYLSEQLNALIVERQQVVEPKFKMLLYPFRTGEPMPVTTWNKDQTALTIDHRNGTVDTIRFTRKDGDPRTYLTLLVPTDSTTSPDSGSTPGGTPGPITPPPAPTDSTSPDSESPADGTPDPITPLPAPTVSAISPARGSTAGGTAVTITGSNLSGTTAVTFGGIDSTAVTVIDATSVTCVTPAHAAGLVDIVLDTPNSSATIPAAFSFSDPREDNASKSSIPDSNGSSGCGIGSGSFASLLAGLIFALRLRSVRRRRPG